MGRGDLSRARGRRRAALGALVLASAVAVTAADAAPVPWETVLRGSRIFDAEGTTAFVARTPAAVRINLRPARPADARRAAATDFDRFAVIGVSHAFPACAWSVKVQSVTRSGQTVTVRYSKKRPPKDVMTCQARTIAYEIIRVPRAQVAGVRAARAVATP
jgi:hypothetical protein